MYKDKKRRGCGEEESGIMLESTEKQLKRERESHGWKQEEHTRDASAHGVNRAGDNHCTINNNR